ncbi:MAG: M28 family peptidase [Gemmataceae bacterium]|nr:M28 family peptidase [Gemmataceae bacterium]
MLHLVIAAVLMAGEAGKAEARLKADVFYLASVECEGRGPGTDGIERAASHIARELQKAGLKPGWKGEWFQPFGIPGSSGTLSLCSPDGHLAALKPRSHFFTVGHESSGKAAAGLVFAGFGLEQPDYDDYEDVAAKGKIVVLMRGIPRAKGWVKPAEGRKLASMSYKIGLARKKGAAGVLFVNDEETAASPDLPMDMSFLGTGQGKDAVPVALVRRDIVEKMLPRGKTLKGLEAGIRKDLKPASLELKGWTAKLEAARDKEGTKLKNVVGVLEGKGPLADETVVVGAHYDHLGWGNPQSSLSGSNKRQLHPGADDNASGTAALLELARRFGAMPNREGRRLVFVAFSGEELGLFGSVKYCQEPAFPLKGTAAMFNLDMVGRAPKDQKTGLAKLYVQGTGTAKPFSELVDDLAKKHGFAPTKQASGFGPSDHSSFCSKKVPVLFAWTGDHKEYHRPSDTPDLVDVKGMRRVTDLSEGAVQALATMARPEFIEVKGPLVRPSKGPRLGIRPGYDPEVEGVEVKGVSPGDPADKGGIKEGDRIVRIADKPVKDMAGYMNALAGVKTPGTIDVVVVRGGKEVVVKVKLE